MLPSWGSVPSARSSFLSWLLENLTSFKAAPRESTHRVTGIAGGKRNCHLWNSGSDVGRLLVDNLRDRGQMELIYFKYCSTSLLPVRGYLYDRNPSVSLFSFKNTTLRLQAYRQNFLEICKSLWKVKCKKSQLSANRSLQQCRSLRPIIFVSGDTKPMKRRSMNQIKKAILCIFCLFDLKMASYLICTPYFRGAQYFQWKICQDTNNNSDLYLTCQLLPHKRVRELLKARIFKRRRVLPF